MLLRYGHVSSYSDAELYRLWVRLGKEDRLRDDTTDGDEEDED